MKSTPTPNAFRGRLSLAFRGMLALITAVPLGAASADTARDELVAEVASTHRAVVNKMQFDVGDTATSLATEASLDSSLYDVAIFAKSMAEAVDASRKLAYSAGVTSLRGKAGANAQSLLLSPLGPPPEVHSGTWHDIVRQVGRLKMLKGLVSAFDTFGSSLVSLEVMAEARAAMDEISAQLYAEMKGVAYWGGNPQTAAQSFISTSKVFGVRRTNATWPRTNGTPFVRLADVVMHVNDAFERISSAVSSGAIPAERIPELTALVRQIRGQVVASGVKRQRVTYPMPGAPDVSVTLVLGQVGDLNRKYGVLLESHNKGIVALQRSYTVGLVKDVVGTIADEAFHKAKANAAKRDMSVIIVTDSIGAIKITESQMLDAARKGLAIAVDEVADLVNPAESKEEVMIETAIVRAEMLKVPVEAMHKLPIEFSALATLVTDIDATFAHARRTPAAPAQARKVPVFFGSNAAGVVVTIVADGSTRNVSVPSTIEASAGSRVTVMAPAKAGAQDFQFFLLDGRKHSTASLTFTPGEGDPLLVFAAAPVAAPTGTPAISGPDTLEAGSTAAYTASGIVPTWDTSDTSIARITSDGRLQPIAAITTDTDIVIFAKSPTLANRLEKRVRITPKKTGAGFKFLRIPTSANFTYDLSPEPARVNDTWVFPSGAVVTLALRASSPYVIVSTGDPTVPVANPIVLTMDRDYELRPVTQHAAAVQGPRVYKLHNPSGIGQIAVSSSQVSGVLPRGETVFETNAVNTNERVKSTLILRPDEIALGGIGCVLQTSTSTQSTAVHDIDAVIRMGYRTSRPESERQRHVEFVLNPNMFEAMTYISRTESGRHEYAATATMVASFYGAQRPGQSDSMTDCFFKIPNYRMGGFPRQVKRAVLVLSRTDKVTNKGAFVLMKPVKGWNAGTLSQMPAVVPYPGAETINVQSRPTVEIDLTKDLNDSLVTGESLGFAIRATMSNWQVSFATAQHGDRNLRPKLILDWVEENPAPSAPILMTRAAPAAIGEDGTAKLETTWVSDGAIAYKWTTVAANASFPAAPTLVVREPGTYRLAATNAVGATIAEFVVAPKPVPDLDAPKVSTELVIKTDAAGVARLTGKLVDASPVKMTIESATATGKVEVSGDSFFGEISAPPGIHDVSLFATDSSNNSTKVRIRLVNPSADKAAPQVSATVQALPGSALAIGYSFVEDLAVDRLEVIANGKVLHSVRLPERTGSWNAPEGTPPSIQVRVIDFAGRTTTVQATVPRRMPQSVTGLPIAPTTEAKMPLRLAATPVATSALPVALTVSGPARLEGAEVVITAAGDVTIEAAQAGNILWEPATAKTTFKVSAMKEPVAPATVTSTPSGPSIPVAPAARGGGVSVIPAPSVGGGFVPSVSVAPTVNAPITSPTTATVAPVAAVTTTPTTTSPTTQPILPGTVTAPVATTPTVVAREPMKRLVNISTRQRLRAVPTIVGFVVAGDAPRKLLVRAVGPGLSGFDVPDYAADPRIRIVADGRTVAENDDWASSGEVAATTPRVGAFALVQGSRDAALVRTFSPGAYSAVVDGIGEVLIEVYDAESGPALVNLSTRSHVDGPLISGFVVDGDAPAQVLVRAIGPTLAVFGVSGTVPDPVLTIHAATGGIQVARNDDWGSPSTTRPDQPVGSAADVAAAARATGAFALPTGSRDAAILTTLLPGAYTATITPANGVPGEGLIEVYQLR